MSTQGITSRAVDTPRGPGRLVLDGDPSAGTVLMLGHGAGGGIEAPDLAALAAQLPARGIAVVRFEQPWRTAGQKVAPAPKRLDEAWCLAVTDVREWLQPATLVLGGRSAGARVACRTASEQAADKVLALAFPLHLPARHVSRDAELLGVRVPTLVVQGTRDPMGTADEVATVLDGHAGFRLHVVPGAGHELTVGKRAQPGTEVLLSAVVSEVAAFIA
ncbi:MAG TPA: hydrolase [Candidatus Luteococcus avicola]|nr:hydrolase [Candidatus Luteococcus avicola]